MAVRWNERSAFHFVKPNMVLPLVAAFAIAQAPHATAEMVSDITAVKAGDSFLVGIIIRPEPGWHVYWTNPGDSGTATSVTWKLPEGWKASELMWPVPSRFSEGELVTYGYETSTLLLARISPPADVAKGKFTIEATVKWLACKGACVAGSADLRLDRSVNENTYEHPVWHERLAQAEKAVPPLVPDWTVAATPIKGGFILKVKPPTPLASSNSLPTFFAADAGVLEAGALQNFRLNDDGTFWLALRASSFAVEPPKRLRGLLIAPKGQLWMGDTNAVMIDVPISAS